MNFPIKNRPRLLAALQTAQLLPSLVAGTVIGVLAVVYSISYAALIFAGDLSQFVANGIGLTLFGTFILGLVTTLRASVAGLIPSVQDAPAAILGVVAAALAGSMPATASAEELFATVVAVMVLTSVLSGACSLGMGWFRLGRLVRFMPYPVIGGFLAGTGWLLVTGSLGLMSGIPFALTAGHFAALFAPPILIKWLPGLVFAVLLLILLRRYQHMLLMPGMLLAAIALFYLTLLFSDTSIAELRDQGWLFAAVAGGSLWQPQTLAAITAGHWALLSGQAGNIAVIILVSLIATILNISGVGLAVGKEIDLDHELKVNGLANLLAGFGGSSPGYITLSLSVLGQRFGGNGRLIGLLTAGLCAVALFFGATLITLFPKVVIGGIVLYLGLSLLVEWVYEAWFRLSRAEYGLVILVLVIIAGFGFLPGVAVGLLVAIGLFVVNYSQVNVIKRAFSGNHFRSTVMRSAPDDQLLEEHGGQVFILQLQGFIFFGTAYNLLHTIQQRLEQPDQPRPRFALLDFRLVTGLDASTVLVFSRLKQLAQSHDLTLVFAHLDAASKAQLAREVFTDQDHELWQVVSDLDHGLEWCEARIIASNVAASPDQVPSYRAAVDFARFLNAHRPALMNYLDRLEVTAGQCLIRQGEPPNGIYFIEEGQVTVWFEEAGARVRLRTMAAGTVVGEMSWYLRQPTSATVIADEASIVQHLSAANLRRMEQETPSLAMQFHSFIASTLCEKVTRTNEVLKILR